MLAGLSSQLEAQGWRESPSVLILVVSRDWDSLLVVSSWLLEATTFLPRGSPPSLSQQWSIESFLCFEFLMSFLCHRLEKSLLFKNSCD